MDIFTWSMPFVAEKIADMFFHILKTTGDEDLSGDEDELNLAEKDKIKQISEGKGINTKAPASKPANSGEFKKSDVLRNKIKFISKMAKY